MPNLTPDQPAPVKRFIVFAHDDYYPLGGWEDFRGSFDTFDEAMADAKVATTRNDPGFYRSDHAEIVDLATSEHTLIHREKDPPRDFSKFWTPNYYITDENGSRVLLAPFLPSDVDPA